MIGFQNAQLQAMDGLWPSLSFIVLVVAAFSTIFILWRRFLSRRMLIRRVAELEALSAAGRAIVRLSKREVENTSSSLLEDRRLRGLCQAYSSRKLEESLETVRFQH